MREHNPKVSIATARVIPVLLVLVAAYGSYAILGPLSINYLLNPPDGEPVRFAAGIAIPIVYFSLLLPVAASWMRLTWVVLFDPGYIPLGLKRPEPNAATGTGHPPGLEAFTEREAFVCDQNGMPIWCTHCNNWKPDRTHHNQDVGRCTRKMDHFCPWVGGVVGENALKFFIQFLGYTSLLTAYVMITFAYFVARHQKNVQWIVALGLSAFFLLFTFGMFVNSTYLACLNFTTIEHMAVGSDRIIHMAVLLPPELQGSDMERHLRRETSTDSKTLVSATTPSHSPKTSKIWKGTITFPLELPIDRPPLPAPRPRTFAILELPARLNPWNLKNPWSNLGQIFGSSPDEWFLPIKRSPCCNHTSSVSEFPLGPGFEEILDEAGLSRRHSMAVKDFQNDHASRKRKRVLDAGWQNGERPDGWEFEKEARRARKQSRRLDREQQTGAYR